MKECCIKCDHAILDNSGLVENYICINRGCVCHKDTPQSNTDWRQDFYDFYFEKGRYTGRKLGPETYINFISQLLEAEKKKWREEVENELNKHIAPHPLSLEDSVWLKRLLNKAFNHNQNV